MIEFKDMLMLVPDHNLEYLDKYLDFIKSRLEVSADKVERHHILPKCLFPEYKSFKECKWNIIRLRPKDHFIAHYLLFMTYPSRSDITRSWRMMFNCRIISNLDLEEYAEDYERSKIMIKDSMVGKKRLLEHRKNMSIGQKKRYENSEEREKCKLINLGRKHTDETKKKVSTATKGDRNPFYGKVHSEETKKRISDSKKGNTKVDYELIKRIANENIGSRWMHLDHISKCVRKDDIEKYLEQGWSFGRLKFPGGYRKSPRTRMDIW
jgi:hypothetical protein